MGIMLPALIVVATMPALFQGVSTGPAVETHVPAVNTRAPLNPKDSSRVMKAARKAQRDFENVRRRLLPREAGLSSAACDAVIGRFCHWQSSGFGPPPEAPQVIEGREKLIRSLDSLGRQLPGSRWILAQRLRYRMEAGREEEAERIAVSCVSRTQVPETRRWCLALSGYAAQERGDYVQADSAFTAALADMPEPERCKWMDMSILLDGKAGGRYRKLGCAQRDSMATSMWRLVQPLYLTGVNDLRTEFLARVTRMYIEEDSRTPLTTGSPGADDRETLLRYGAGVWYTQEDAPVGSMLSNVIASHRRGPAFNFFPLARALAAFEQLRPDDWEFQGLAPRMGYAPPYAQRFLQLRDHQLALFRRGDSAVVVAAWDVSREEGFTAATFHAGVFAAPVGPHGVSAPIGNAVPNAPPVFVSTLRAPWKPMIISLEVLDRENHSAERARYSVAPPAAGPRLGLSDLLMYTPRDSAPRSLEEAVPLAMHVPRVRRTRQMGFFWETYGVRTTGETLEYSLVVNPAAKSWVGRAFDKLRRREPTSISIHWREVPSVQDGIAPRALAVDLALLRPGRYRVQLTMNGAGEPAVFAWREIDVLE